MKDYSREAPKVKKKTLITWYRVISST